MSRRIGAVILTAVLLAGCGHNQRERDAWLAVALAPVWLMTQPTPKKSNNHYWGFMPDAKPYPGDDTPLYRGVTKSSDVLKSEAEFLKNAEEKAGSRTEAEWSLRKSGWGAIRGKHYREAALRLNQAWLIDPGNGDIYYGLALVAWLRDNDMAYAEELFRKGLELPREVGLIHLKYGALLLALHRPQEAIPHLRLEAEGKFGSGEAQALLVVALDAGGDHSAACQEAQNVRPKAINEALLAEVQRRTANCPKVQP